MWITNHAFSKDDLENEDTEIIDSNTNMFHYNAMIIYKRSY
jgi:hypothetical protein